MKELPKNFSGRLGHFHQCSGSGAFINKKPSPELQHQKQLKSLREEHQDKLSDLQERMDKLEQVIQSFVNDKKKPSKTKE